MTASDPLEIRRQIRADWQDRQPRSGWTTSWAASP